MTLQEHLAPGKYKLTVDDYLRLDETGVFGTHRTELLDGDIIIMNAEYRPHGRIRDELLYLLRRALEELGSDLTPMGGSVQASENDMPMPDISLTREPRGEGPIPLRSVALSIEVSSTTLRRDMVEKTAIYARAGIAEYWIADVNARVIHQMWNPVDHAYRDRRDIAFGERLTAATITGLTIDTVSF